MLIKHVLQEFVAKERACADTVMLLYDAVSQFLNLIFASNTFCVPTITFLPALFEVTTALCNLVGEKRMREKEGGMKC